MRLMTGSVILFVALAASALGATITVTNKELECYSQEKVYHQESDKCYKLLTKGPCETGEWLVLDKPRNGERKARVHPVCARERCEEGEYYWSETRSCVESKDKSRLCGESEELLSNVFGEGECACAREPPRARINGDRKSPCYQLYTRGPCQAGQIIALPEEEMAKATCIDDPCRRETTKRKKTGGLAKDGVLAAFENGTCYELGTQGPCPDDLIFKVHAGLMRPSCVSLTTNIFSLQKPPNCYQDENGDCQKRVTPDKRRDAEKYKVELLNSLKGRGLTEAED